MTRTLTPLALSLIVCIAPTLRVLCEDACWQEASHPADEQLTPAHGDEEGTACHDGSDDDPSPGSSGCGHGEGTPAVGDKVSPRAVVGADLVAPTPPHLQTGHSPLSLLADLQPANDPARHTACGQYLTPLRA